MWGAGQDGLRRLAASQLVDTGAAQVNEVAAAFGVNTESLRRWRKSLEGSGLMGLAPVKKGPKRALQNPECSFGLNPPDSSRDRAM